MSYTQLAQGGFVFPQPGQDVVTVHNVLSILTRVRRNPHVATPGAGTFQGTYLRLLSGALR
jgi:hypothetical protein